MQPCRSVIFLYEFETDDMGEGRPQLLSRTVVSATCFKQSSVNIIGYECITAKTPYLDTTYDAMLPVCGILFSI